jgi:NAD(P)H-dependent flavin oxidoreductase YrpB (nitropropane dioxygenase family)
MRTEIQKTKSLTNKPFGVPVIVNRDLAFTWPILETVIDEKVPVVIVNDILDERIFKPLKENNIKIVYRPLTPTIENAKAAEEFGIDVYVATGFDEGGTVPERVIGTFSIVPMIVDATAEDLLMFRTLPAFYRSLPTKFANKLVEMDKQGASLEETAKMMRGSIGMRIGMLEGNTDHGYISIGTGITPIKEIRTVKEVVDTLMQDFN